LLAPDVSSATLSALAAGDDASAYIVDGGLGETAVAAGAGGGGECTAPLSADCCTAVAVEPGSSASMLALVSAAERGGGGGMLGLVNRAEGT